MHRNGIGLCLQGPSGSSTLPSTESSVAGRIAKRASERPEAEAVVDDASRLTFAELHQLSERLAACLHACGVGPESCVGLLLERSADFVVAALAVWKAGAAYLPLDPATPVERATLILTDAGARHLVTHRGKASDWNGPWQTIDMDRPAGQAADPFAPREPDLESLAYVVYTSGSSGRPKGVEITHGNLLNLVDWHVNAFGVNVNDRASQVAGLAFDAAVWEIWPSLAAGASLHFADEATRRVPAALVEWLVAEKITIGFVPTVLAEPLLQVEWPLGTALRCLLTGADVLHRRPVVGVPFVVVNNYGPSECTVVATSGVVAADSGDGVLPSIGAPIRNMTALVLDEQLRPVAPGEPGELCLAGASVGRGYRNLPEMTASRFVTYVPESGPELRTYRTGDRVRQLPTGELAFLGRLDEQIKIRGYRIEPGEIAAWLDRYPGIEASAIALMACAAGPALVAYVVLAWDARVTAGDLREFLAARLPEYMIPTSFVKLSALPMTANGKLDKEALPAATSENVLPMRAAGEPAGAHDAAGVDGVQSRLAEVVAALVNQPSIGADENFFMIGGHSMLGVQLVARIRDLFGVKLTLRQLFGAPTVAGLSRAIAEHLDARSPSEGSTEGHA